MTHFAKSIRIGTLLILLSLMVSDAAFSSELSDVELLRKTYKNQRLVSHRGVLNTIVFFDIPQGHVATDEKPEVRKSKRSKVEIFQKNGMMRMDYKSGDIARMSIIDDGKNMIHIDYKNRTVAIKPIPFSNDDILLLLSNYEIVSKDGEKIAERPTLILQLEPRYSGNPSKKLWIDTETFMPLKREYYNSDGVLITRSFYTKIDYDAQIEDSVFSPPKKWRVLEAPPQNMRKFPKKQLSEIVEFHLVEPKYVPAGYVLDGFYLFSPPIRPKKTGSKRKRHEKGVHLRYVDGLNCISVFEVLPDRFRGGMGRMRRRFAYFFRGSQRNKRITKKTWSRGRRMRRRMSSSSEAKDQQERPHRRMLGNRQGKMIRMMIGELNIIVAGDIAEAELQKIADSLK